MTERIPTAVKSGELKIGDVVLKTHVLNDGQRIIEEESMIAFFEYLASGGSLTGEDAKNVARFVKGLPEEIDDGNNPND